MNGLAVRQELHGFIDAMPEQNLYALKPLLSALSKAAYKKRCVIEPANAEESAMIDEAMREYEKDPSCFVDWETAKRELGIAAGGAE